MGSLMHEYDLRPGDPRIYAACMRRWRLRSRCAELRGSVSAIALAAGSH